jgi:hypothetical protein
MSELPTRAIILLALVLAAPWPWYLFAVGGLMPVPVIVLWAVSDPSRVVMVMLLLSAILGVVVFLFASRSIARAIARARPAVRPYALAGALGVIVAVSLMPVYGGGENLATPAGKFSNLYAAYWKNLRGK